MIRRQLTAVGLKRVDIEQMEACLQRKLKNLDEVLGGPNAWENAEVTNEKCPRCAHGRAYFMQLQTQSADEPATILYRCEIADCSHRWKDLFDD